MAVYKRSYEASAVAALRFPARLSAGTYWVLVVLLALGAIWGLILPECERLAGARARLTELAQACALLSARNARLERDLKQLSMGDPFIWERIIRDRLRWVGAGEVPARPGGGFTHQGEP